MEYTARHPALTKGISSLNWNPAWRGQDPYIFQIYVEPLALDFWNNTLDLKTFEEIFPKHWANGDEMEGSGYVLGEDYIQKETVLDLIPQGGIHLGLSLSPQAGILLGPVAVRGQLRGYSHFTLDKDLLELFIKGNDFNQYYSIEKTRGEMAAFGDISLSILLPLPFLKNPLGLESFYVGGTYHYLEGLGLVKVFNEGKGFCIDFNEDQIGVSGDNTFIIQYSTKGRGQSLDLGIYTEIRPGISLGLSAMDLLGAIVWDKVHGHEMRIVLGDDETGELENGDEGLMINSLTQRIPTSLNLGLALHLLPRFQIGAGLSRIMLEDRTYHEASGGFEWSGFLILPSIRGGARYMEGVGTTFYGGTGFNLGPLQINLGFSDLRLPLKMGMGATIGAGISFGF